jgi:hypothetical protein
MFQKGPNKKIKVKNTTFFEFFSSISWGLCTDTKCAKVVLFGFSTGTKGEFRIFEEQKFNFLLFQLCVDQCNTSFVRGFAVKSRDIEPLSGS